MGTFHAVRELDGSENTYVDESLGDLPNFVRKIRTKARWVGSSTLLTERTSFAEQTDPNTGRVTIPAGAITLVDAIELSPDGVTLTIERTGFRAIPPDLLHGKSYDIESDPAAARYTDIFRKASP